VSTPALKRALATAADLAARPERPRAEVIRGAIVEKASPSYEHGRTQGSLVEILNPPFYRGRGGPGGWWIATEVELELETHEVYLPDVAGWRRDRVPEEPRGRPIRIRPDWVAEVLSKATAKHDVSEKLFSYHRAGVPHYWVLDPIHELLTVYAWNAAGYVALMMAGRGERVRAAPFTEIEIEVTELFGLVPPATA
jgi:Uma2 family endonuclease